MPNLPELSAMPNLHAELIAYAYACLAQARMPAGIRDGIGLRACSAYGCLPKARLTVTRRASRLD